MKVKKINHIGLAVDALEPVREMYSEILGLSMDHEEMWNELKIAFVPVGETNLELVQSTSQEGDLAKFVSKKGQGIHHIALEVEDIEGAVQELLDKGMHLIDEKPRKGSNGTTIAFLHPKATHGIMIELVEPA
jgi:methylmalonyl-CoA epimerase